ncbi:MAG: peptidoglycan-binding protein, partial [Candidatus Pacebacteria bacterium]|nr:peptidoglycan-binding protein [Candidatus Paceibacterota bacterium]
MTKLHITVITLLIVGAVAAPSVSRALTNDQLLQQIARLLSTVQLLQAQLIAVEGGQTVGPVVGVPVTPQGITAAGSGTCVNITRTLKRGSENADVEELQRFLTKTGDYTYGETTGYYGSVTEAAVKSWQAKTGLVSSGTAATTGYGVVGPKTRNAMRAQCGGAAGNIAVERDLVITPKIGQLPLQVTATFSLNSSSCSSFSLDWGDGTKPLSFDAGNTTTCTKDIAHKRATHTYNVPGTHRVTFRAGRGPLSLAGVVTQMNVSVGDTAPVGFSLSPTSGSAPLATSITFPVVGSTCTSYEADWGDGTVDRHEASGFNTCSQDSGTQSLTHTYATAGSYTVKFKTGRAPTAQLEINEQWAVLVRNDIAAAASVQISPTAGTTPLTVKVEMFGFGETCTSYSLDWGDSSSIQVFDAPAVDCNGQQFQKTFTHTYIAAGNYSIKTKLGSQTKLRDLPENSQTILVGFSG